MERLSGELRVLASECAAVLEKACSPPARDAADAEKRSLFPNADLDGIVERLIRQEAVDVPGLLAKRRPGEERKEDPAAARVNASLLSVLEFDIGSLVARRNGLGPAHERNRLRERVPTAIHCQGCAEHMRRGLQIIFANALLRTTPNASVRTRLVVAPREKLRRELDLLVAGSGERPPPPAFVVPAFEAMPDVSFEMEEVTAAREDYLRALRETEVILDPVDVDDDRVKDLGPAKQLMRGGFKDAALKRLDGMLQEAEVRRRRMMQSNGGEFGALFAESLRAAGEARQVRRDLELQLSDPDPLEAERRVYQLANQLVEAERLVQLAKAAQRHSRATVTKQEDFDRLVLAGGSADTDPDLAEATLRYRRADALFAAALGSDLAEVYCHRSLIHSMQAPPPPPRTDTMTLEELMALRFSIAVDLLTSKLR